MSPIQTSKMTNYRWLVCSMLFLATLINYMDRQVLAMTWREFIAPELAWNDEVYGQITAVFLLVYAVCMPIAGKLIDMSDIKNGYAWAMGIWSVGAILHAFCGIATCGVLTGEWFGGFDESKETLHRFGISGIAISTVSVYMFMVCRCVLAIGESGNFPAAIEATAKYFPKKDRAFAISLFNSGASIGALITPAIIPLLARRYGWEMAFIAIGSLGYLWMLMWILLYVKPQYNDHLNMAEYNYIRQDDTTTESTAGDHEEERQKVETEHSPGLLKCLTYPQTWALSAGKFLSDGVWWFILFWTPAYISEFYGYSSNSTMGISLIFVLYLLSLLSVGGGYLPTYFVNKLGMTPYSGRMKAMLIFAILQLLGFFAVPFGAISPWMFILIIGILAASHQSWSANLFAMIGDIFPKKSIATVTGITGMAGGMASYTLMKESGKFFTYTEHLGDSFSILGYNGKQAAYLIVFSLFSMLYLIGWSIIKLMVADPQAHRKK